MKAIKQPEKGSQASGKDAERLLEEVLEARKLAERAKRDRDRSEGELRAVRAQAEKELGCRTLKDLKVLTARLEREGAAARTALERELKRFQKEHGERL